MYYFKASSGKYVEMTVPKTEISAAREIGIL